MIVKRIYSPSPVWRALVIPFHDRNVTSSLRAFYSLKRMAKIIGFSKDSKTCISKFDEFFAIFIFYKPFKLSSCLNFLLLLLSIERNWYVHFQFLVAFWCCTLDLTRCNPAGFIQKCQKAWTCSSPDKTFSTPSRIVNKVWNSFFHSLRPGKRLKKYSAHWISQIKDISPSPDECLEILRVKPGAFPAIGFCDIKIRNRNHYPEVLLSNHMSYIGLL